MNPVFQGRILWGGGGNCYFQLNNKNIIKVLRMRTVEIDKWTTFYKAPVDSRPQDVCTALVACDQNCVPAIKFILIIFVLSHLVVL